MTGTVHLLGSICEKRSTSKALFFIEADTGMETHIPRSQVHSKTTDMAGDGVEIWISEWFYAKTWRGAKPEVRRCPHCKGVLDA